MIRRLSGFILCAILLSIPSHSDAQTCVWTPYQNTLIYGGTGSSTATSLPACQSLCVATNQCVGVDWDPTNTGSKCYLQNKKTGKVSNQTGVTHYDYDCDGTVTTVISTSFSSAGSMSTTFPSVITTASACVWTPYQNTLIYGGTGSSTATSLPACQSLCVATAQCVGVDWDPTNTGSKCYLQNKKTDKVSNQTGVTHYDYDCNGTSATVTGSSSSSVGSTSTTFPSVITTASVCVWTPYQNTLIYGGTGSSTATSLPACQSLCMATAQCVGVDWDPTNTGSKCYLQNKKTGKVSNQTGVTHYDYDCNGTSATVTVSSSSSTGSTSSSSSTSGLTTASACVWTPYQNTLIYGGTGSSTATSLPACQSLCLVTAQCVGIDWDPTNTGSKCYLQNKKTGKVSNQTGVTHYDYDCNGTAATVTGSGPSSPPSPPPPTIPPSPACRVNFEYSYNTTSIGGLFISEITSQLQCFDSCVTLPECLGFDLSGPDYSLCWLYFDPENFRQKYFKLDLFQYSINRCPEQDIGKCIPSYDTNNVLNDSCSTICYPEWRRYDNYAGSLTGSWKETQPWNFNECLSTCVATPGCIGIELRNQPGIPSACRYYGSGDRNALMNITLTAFVTQYSIVNTCAKKCNVTWEKLSRTSIRLTNPTPRPNVATEADCLKACRVASSCLVAQWRVGVDPGCTLADSYIPNTMIPNGAAVTYIYRESCPAPPPLPTPPTDGSSSITTSRSTVGGSSTGSSPASSSSTTFRSSSTTFPLSSTTPSQSCWVQMNDTLIDQGVGNSATSIPQCQAACQAQTSPKCLSVDWDKTKLTPSETKCFLHSTSQGRRPAPGVDHYDFIC